MMHNSKSKNGPAFIALYNLQRHYRGHKGGAKRSVEDREDLLIFSNHDTRTNGLVGSGEVEKSLV